MIKQVDDMLWRWGEWAGRSSLPSGRKGLSTTYSERGVMSTSPPDDDPQSERIDRLVACMPPYLRLARKAIIRKYLWRWLNDDVAKDLHIGRQKLNTLLDRAHVWLDAKMADELYPQKNIDKRAHAV